MLALGIINPEFYNVAINLCSRPDEEFGLKGTNFMAQSLGQNIRALKGRSQIAVLLTVAVKYNKPMELVFIVGGHTPDYMTKNFTACQEVASEYCVYVFDDVINFSLTDAFIHILRRAFTSTPTFAAHPDG